MNDASRHRSESGGHAVGAGDVELIRSHLLGLDYRLPLAHALQPVSDLAVLHRDRELVEVLDYHPPLEPWVDHQVGQRNTLPQQERSRNRSLDPLQEGVHLGHEGRDVGYLARLGTVEEVDDLGIDLAHPHPHLQSQQFVLGDELGAGGEGLGQVPADQLAFGDVVGAVDEDGNLAVGGGVPGDRAGVGRGEQFRLGIITQSGGDELGIDVLLDGRDEGPLCEGAVFVINDGDLLLLHTLD